MNVIKLSVAAFGLLTACSTSLETRVRHQITSPDRALSTKGYSLPMLQYELLVTYKLSECEPLTAGDPPSKLDFKVEALAASTYVPGERFEIDYEKLSSPLKVSDFTIETYANGTLKSINASADDKTGDVIKSLVESGVSVASMAMGNPAAFALPQSDDAVSTAANRILAAAKREKIVMKCSSNARAALATAVALRQKAKALTVRTNARAKQIEAITVRAGLKLSDQADAARIFAIHEAMMPDLEELATVQTDLAEAEKALIFAEDRLWPNDPRTTEGTLALSKPALFWFSKFTMAQKVTVLDPAVIDQQFQASAAALTAEDRAELKKLLDAALSRQPFDTTQLCDASATISACLEATFGIYAQFLTDRPAPPPCLTPPSANRFACQSDDDTVAAQMMVSAPGVFYRDPARARLLLCDKGRSCAGGDRPELVLTEWDSAPQLGQLRFAKFTNGPFQNNLLVLSLRDDGSAEKFQYAEKSSVLAAMAATAASGLAKVDAAEQDREKRRRQQILDRRADITYQRSEIAAERIEAAAVRVDELAQLQYEFDKVTKDRALLDIRIPPSVSKEYANETIRLEAIGAQLRARIAIKQAEEQLNK